MASLIALDSNLALLLAVGAEDRNFIARHKRLAAYQPTDFDLLAEFLRLSAGIVFCPNVVSETSNLIRYANEPVRSAVAGRFALIVKEMTEEYVSSAGAVDHPAYIKLGTTDAVLLTLAKTGALLLTVDLDLYLAAANAGLPVINFNHEREARF